ncbi:hypothetical protein [Pandoraea sp. XY-2]|uniref:hypothetical protein n=1 Tax=Pandoraea sp. XY-2 TaxID=2518599 RepID=UPI0010218BFD|nr:hypothetical protein [Pandoraea sp. XY-2]
MKQQVGPHLRPVLHGDDRIDHGEEGGAVMAMRTEMAKAKATGARRSRAAHAKKNRRTCRRSS